MGNIKLVSGKFKPSCTVNAFVLNLFLDMCLIGLTVWVIFQILSFPDVNFVAFVLGGILVVALDYFILLSPYQQYTENYYIEFLNENSLEGFKLFYRKKEVLLLYKVNENGKFEFCEDNKLNCISYVDGTKMSRLTKRRIINYFSRWLEDNRLILR